MNNSYNVTFEEKLRELINQNCIENESNTPDFILAQYIKGCLLNYANTVMARDKWYGVSHIIISELDTN